MADAGEFSALRGEDVVKECAAQHAAFILHKHLQMPFNVLL